MPTTINCGFDKRAAFREGLRDGMPIGLGYFAVSFSLGVAAKSAGLTVFQGFLASLLTNASAGEYAVFLLIGAGASYWETVLVTLVTNARYLLMSCALSQKFSVGTRLRHRLLIGADITDETFGITIARPGPVEPLYNYGAMASSVPFWAGGTAAGILAGNLLPLRLVSALSVALYGMFLAVIIPTARKNRVVAILVLSSFLLSFLLSRLPLLSGLSAGTQTIVLTVAISAAAAALFPVKDQEENAHA